MGLNTVLRVNGGVPKVFTFQSKDEKAKRNSGVHPRVSTLIQPSFQLEKEKRANAWNTVSLFLQESSTLCEPLNPISQKMGVLYLTFTSKKTKQKYILSTKGLCLKCSPSFHILGGLKKMFREFVMLLYVGGLGLQCVL